MAPRQIKHYMYHAAFLRSRQGPLFVAGCWMLLGWVATAAVLWQLGSEMWDDIIHVGFMHLMAGRAISIAQGTHVGLPRWLIIVIATYVDVTGMLLVYPLFVYSYEHFVEGRFFQRRMRPMLESARKNVHSFGRYKIIGVFFFVWLPFWMTGIIVGAILGYLLHMRTWVIILTTTLGALAAVASWVYAYDQVYRWLAAINQDLGLATTVVLIAGLLTYRIMRKRRDAQRRRREKEEEH